jgi:hypothetical protein
MRFGSCGCPNLRYALKTSSHPHRLWQEETERLQVGPQLASLLVQFVPTY